MNVKNWLYGLASASFFALFILELKKVCVKTVEFEESSKNGNDGNYYGAMFKFDFTALLISVILLSISIFSIWTLTKRLRR